MPTATPVRRCSRSNACSCCCLPRKAGPGWPSGNCDASVVGGGENVANVPDGTIWLKGRDAGSVKVRVRVRPLMSCQADRLATFARLREKVTEGRMRALAAPVVPNALHPTSQNAPPPRPYAPSDQRSAISAAASSQRSAPTPPTSATRSNPTPQPTKCWYPRCGGCQGLPSASCTTTPGAATIWPMWVAATFANSIACATASRCCGAAVKHNS